MTPDSGNRRLFKIVRQPDGSWTYHPQPPLPATTAFLVGGWPEVAALRGQLDAVEWFPDANDYSAFVAAHGEPPAGR